MPAYAIHLVLSLWVLLVAAGCGPSSQSTPTTQATRYEAPSTEGEKKAAIDAHIDCLYKYAREMDDGRSDARTIAVAVRSSCRSLYTQSLVVFIQGESPQTKRLFYDRSQNNDLDAATTVVVRTRANKNGPPATRPAVPTSTPAATPPPMIPPG